MDNAFIAVLVELIVFNVLVIALGTYLIIKIKGMEDKIRGIK